ncbi:hypothetical protein [Streptomyces californicus]|uniref:hypothetical protein n=1 Tax=Streptomyces californicus TaxID=67351 RepID=UPI00296E31F9|nr:hypothetical protein [Streptomyces californicus]MDW4912469.1 hypothetical protein [Streptomyces californicus]
MRSKLGFLLALVLLSFAFPTATMLAFQSLCSAVSAVMIAAAWVQANLSLVCFAGSLGALLYFFPDVFRRTARWLGRALVDSVRSVMPQEQPKSPTS